MSYYDGRKQRNFLAGDDAREHLAVSMHKKYSITFIWGHPPFAYVTSSV